jgi:Tol biopolymer transport system component
VNTRGFDGGPSVSSDGRELFFVSDRPGGQGGGDLWVAPRDPATGMLGPPQNLGPQVNSAANEGSPSISTDGRTLFFECFDQKAGPRCFKPEFGSPDLWMASRAASGQPFGPARSLGGSVNTRFAESFPAISAEGLTLYFASDRPGGSGDVDLWEATRPTVTSTFGSVHDLGAAVNSASYDSEPAISADGLVLLFASTREGGFGGQDLWVATRDTTTDPFGQPINLGPRINTGGYDGRPDLSADGSTLFFMSSRLGGQGFMDLYQVAITGRKS